MLLPSLLALLHQRVARLVSYCARPTRAFLGRALREHRRLTGHPPSHFHPSPLIPPPWPPKFPPNPLGRSPNIRRAAGAHRDGGDPGG